MSNQTVATQKPSSKYQQRQNKPTNRRSAPVLSESATVTKLKAELAEAKKSQGNLQTLSEIKHLKGRITSYEKLAKKDLSSIINLMEALEKLGVPAAISSKLSHGEKIEAADFADLTDVKQAAFKCLITK